MAITKHTVLVTDNKTIVEAVRDALKPLGVNVDVEKSLTNETQFLTWTTGEDLQSVREVRDLASRMGLFMHLFRT